MCHKSGLQNGEIWKYQIGVAVWKAKTDLSENTDGAKKKCKSCTHVLCCTVLCCAILACMTDQTKGEKLHFHTVN